MGLPGEDDGPDPPCAGSDVDNDLAAAVALRLTGYAEIEAVKVRELRQLTEGDAAMIADDLLQLLPLLPEEPDRGSGLIEQQRIFSRLRG